MYCLTSEYVLKKSLEHVLAALTSSNALVARVCLHTGLRVSDVLELKTQQLAARFWVTEKKTGKRRMVGLPAELLEAVKAQSGEVWAFPGRDPRKHRTRQAVWKDIKRAATAFRLRENVTPHSLRKVYAVELLERYGDFDKVRRNLNHAYDSTTALYAMADELTRKGLTRRAGRGKLNNSKTSVHRKGGRQIK